MEVWRKAVSNPAPVASSPESNPVIENKYYRITIDAQSGVIQSIFDKELRELVDKSSPYRFGQYLYVTGGDPKGNGQTQMIHPSKLLPVAQLVVHPATKGEYVGAQKTAWGYSIKLRSSDVNTPEIDLEILQLTRTNIHSANLCNAVEDNLHDLDVADNKMRLMIHPHEVLTVRLTP